MASLAQLERGPGEDTATYIQRISRGWDAALGRLDRAREKNGDLELQLDVTNGQLQQTNGKLAEVLREQLCQKKLNPLYLLLIAQFVAGLNVYLEERLTDGKPYFVLPTALASGIGAIIAYMLDSGRALDATVAALNAALLILNVRYMSARGNRARNREESGAAKTPPKDEDKEE